MAAEPLAKLTKVQRSRLLTPEMNAMAWGLSDDLVLALHDLLHAIMESRGRQQAGGRRVPSIEELIK